MKTPDLKTQDTRLERRGFPSSTYNMGDGESSVFDEPNPKTVYQPARPGKARREDQLSSQSMIS